MFFAGYLGGQTGQKVSLGKKNNLGEQLAFLSVKHNCYVGDLFRALLSAKNSGKSTCDELSINHRGKIQKENIFLITKNSGEVIMQFRVLEESLLDKDIRFESWMQTDKIRKQVAKQNMTHRSTTIGSLRVGMKKVNLDASVLEIPASTLVHTRFGADAVVVNVLIGDSSGKIKVCLWNKASETVAVGDIIAIKNASVSSFRGEKQLRIGRAGIINVLERRTTKSEQTRDVSKKVIYT